MASWNELEQLRADVAMQERDLERLAYAVPVSPEAAARAAETRSIVRRGLHRLRATLADAERSAT